jgi:SAM-dependent methyltransferase
VSGPRRYKSGFAAAITGREVLMLGQAIAPLYPAPRRWLQRVWGAPDNHTRQQWDALWPHLARLPRAGVRPLDAGSGDDGWTSELAARRPGWHVAGIDRSRERVAQADAACRRLHVCNADFVRADFLAYRPADTYDAVLTVASAHYLAEEGEGAPLFQRSGDWLAPGGHLLFFGPRGRDEVPRLAYLPPPFRLRDLLDGEALLALCRGAGLTVDLLARCLGPLATHAKQLSCLAGGSRAMSAASCPVQLLLTACDGARAPEARRGRSAAWLLVAHRRAPAEG